MAEMYQGPVDALRVRVSMKRPFWWKAYCYLQWSWCVACMKEPDVDAIAAFIVRHAKWKVELA